VNGGPPPATSACCCVPPVGSFLPAVLGLLVRCTCLHSCDYLRRCPLGAPAWVEFPATCRTCRCTCRTPHWSWYRFHRSTWKVHPLPAGPPFVPAGASHLPAILPCLPAGVPPATCVASRAVGFRAALPCPTPPLNVYAQDPAPCPRFAGLTLAWVTWCSLVCRFWCLASPCPSCHCLCLGCLGLLVHCCPSFRLPTGCLDTPLPFVSPPTCRITTVHSTPPPTVATTVIPAAPLTVVQTFNVPFFPILTYHYSSMSYSTCHQHRFTVTCLPFRSCRVPAWSAWVPAPATLVTVLPPLHSACTSATHVTCLPLPACHCRCIPHTLLPAIAL